MLDGSWFGGLIPDLSTLPVGSLLTAVFLIAFLETTLVIGVPLPGEVLLVGAVGAMAPEWVLPGALTAVAGSVAGQTVGYLIGRRLGPALRSGWIGRRSGERAWARAERLVLRSGGRLLITARFVAVAHTLAPPMAGVLRMPARRFLLFAGISSVAWAGLWVGVARLIRHFGESIDQNLLSGLLVIGGIVLAAVLIGRAVRAPADESGSGIPVR